MIKIKSIDYYIKNLNVLYEDNHLIVVSKPVGILSQKDITGDFALTDIINEYLKKKYEKKGEAYVGLVHRLDRRVGGVMVLAKSSKAASRLSDDIKEYKVNKYYVFGIVTENDFEDLSESTDSSGIGKPKMGLLGGTANTTSSRNILVILMTPEVLQSPLAPEALMRDY